MNTFRKEEIKRILVVRLRFIGDVLLTTPLLKNLKTALPEAKIYYLTEKVPARILDCNPNVSGIIELEKGNILEMLRTVKKIRMLKFDLAIDIFGNPRSSLLTAFSGAKYRAGWQVRGRSKGYNIILSPSKAKSSALKVYEDVLASLGFNTPCKHTELFLTSCEKAEAEKYYSVKGILKNDRIIGLQPGASWPAKIWKKKGFAALGDRLHKEGYKIVLFGGPKDRHITKEVYELMKTKPILANGGSLRADAALIEKLNCFVTNDHGPMHISVAVGTPLVAVFGPGEPEIWFPYEDKKYVFIQNRQKCAPCRKKECEDMKCMESVSVEQVYEKVREVCR